MARKCCSIGCLCSGGIRIVCDVRNGPISRTHTLALSRAIANALCRAGMSASSATTCPATAGASRAETMADRAGLASEFRFRTGRIRHRFRAEIPTATNRNPKIMARGELALVSGRQTRLITTNPALVRCIATGLETDKPSSCVDRRPGYGGFGIAAPYYKHGREVRKSGVGIRGSGWMRAEIKGTESCLQWPPCSVHTTDIHNHRVRCSFIVAGCV
jgi:hypothetical protein